MRYQNRRSKIWYIKETSKNISTTDIIRSKSGKINKKQKLQFYRKRKRSHASSVREPGSLQYVFYAVLNTDLRMDQGTAAATIACGLISLYSQLDSDQARSQYIDTWMKTGQKIIVLKGYDHKHLKYLEEEVKYVAIETHTVRQPWNRGRMILALSVFGQKEDLEDVFEGLSYLR